MAAPATTGSKSAIFKKTLLLLGVTTTTVAPYQATATGCGEPNSLESPRTQFLEFTFHALR